MPDFLAVDPGVRTGVASVAPDKGAALCRIGWQVTDSGCWEWSAARTAAGYGELRYERTTVRAHRLAYEAWVGTIPDGQVVRHKCDNPPCINPDHLETGTQRDNMRDMSERGRHGKTGAKGSTNGQAKLTEQQVRDILIRCQTERSNIVIANDYGVHKGTIKSIRARRFWKHVEV